MLRVENLDVFYGDVQALDGVSLDIEEGAIVAIVGANGAGKTTLIRALAGMLPQARGRIVFRDTDISALAKPSRLRPRIRPGRRRPSGFSDAHRSTENLDIGRDAAARSCVARRQPRAGVGDVSASWPNGRGSLPARCPAASSRCSPSGAV